MAIVMSMSLVTCADFVMVLCLLIRRLGNAGCRLPVTPEWIDELSIERYQPMMRLLDVRDLEFLRAQPGFTQQMVRNLRAQRCQIFSGYLRCLSADFARVCSALRVFMVQSRHDRPDLASTLIRSQVQFACGLVSVRFRVFLYRWGLCSIDVRGLVQIFDGMRLELRSLVPAAVPVL